ncbi:HNH endonuclease family protein [Streptacidiphilus sp. EB103A]|uniref:HNH endonuclease family protein n=1 Tax=Streptacidiphilus sp. EB103A TaxID=3156275 RepID=UPI00351919A4
MTRPAHLAAGTAALLLLTGCAATATQAQTRPDSAPQAGTAAAALAELPVKGRAPKTGYNRVGDFGPAWSDNTSAPGGHDGCDTRDQVLRRDLTNVRFKGTPHCTVASGTLHDPYTGHTIAFVRGPQSTRVQVDHIAALMDVWQTGAQQLTQDQREALANDPLELLAVDGPTNEAKGDGDAATWLPPAKSFRCTYAARQIAVKAKYRLWVTPAEKDALRQVLATCPGQPLPTESSAGVAFAR